MYTKQNQYIVRSNNYNFNSPPLLKNSLEYIHPSKTLNNVPNPITNKVELTLRLFFGLRS